MHMYPLQAYPFICVFPGAAPPPSSGSLGAGGVAAGGAEDEEGDLEDPPEISEFTRELGEGTEDLGAPALELRCASVCIGQRCCCCCC